MEPIKKDSSLWWAMRIKDPLIRKQAIENIKAQPEWVEWKSDRNYSCIVNIFNWEGTPQGHDYWEDIYSRYNACPSLWAEYPIYDELPSEYWVQNPWPNNEDSEFVSIVNETLGNGICGANVWYKMDGEEYDWSNNEKPDDDLPILSYDNWKELVLGTTETDKNGRKKLSFRTEDGYDIYEDNKAGDYTWVQRNINNKYYIGGDCRVTEEHKSLLIKEADDYKLFHSKENAEKWIKEQNEKQSQPEQVTSTVKESKPADIVWKVGNEVKIFSTFSIIEVTETHISLGDSTPGTKDSVYTIEEANDYIRRKVWTMIEKEDTSTVKESVPERKWKVGDRFTVKGDDEIYTLAMISEENVYVTWPTMRGTGVSYSIEKVDKNWNTYWIPYTPEPVPVTVENAVVGMKVTDTGKSDYGDTFTKVVGTIETICKNNRYAMVRWNSTHCLCHYLNGKELYIAPENTVTKEVVKETVSTTNNQPTKTEQNEKHSNKQEDSSICNINPYTGKSLCEEGNPETISTGRYTKGQSLSVYAEPDNISRGQRTTGVSLSCW